MTELRTPLSRALHRGLGRAIQRLRDEGEVDTRNLVLDACLHNRAYDPQIEGDRTDFLLEAAALADLTGALTAHLIQLLETVDEAEEDHWSLQQRVDLLVGLSRTGRPEADEALDALYLSRRQQGGTLLGMLETALVAAYGAEGLLRVLRDRAARSSDQPELWDQELLWHAQRKLDSEVFGRALKAARDELQVEEYLDALDALSQQARADRRPAGTAPFDHAAARQAVTEALARDSSFCPSVLRSDRLTAEALALLAADLEAEDDPATLRLLLCAFLRRTYPNPPARLLTLTRHADSGVAKRAVMALRRFRQPEVRDLAVRLLTTDSNRRLWAAELLVSNFEDGDERLLRSALEDAAQEDHDLLHTYCRDVCDVAEAHPAPGMLALLADTYSHQPCAHCRHQALLLLTHHGAVPDGLRHEASLDADLETRALFRTRPEDTRALAKVAG